MSYEFNDLDFDNSKVFEEEKTITSEVWSDTHRARSFTPNRVSMQHLLSRLNWKIKLNQQTKKITNEEIKEKAQKAELVKQSVQIVKQNFLHRDKERGQKARERLAHKKLAQKEKDKRRH